MTTKRKFWAVGAYSVTGLLVVATITYAYLVVGDKEQEREEAFALSRAIEEGQVALVVVSDEGVVTSWSRGAESLFGLPREMAVGKSIRMLLPSVAYVASQPDKSGPRTAEMLAERKCDVTVWPAKDGAVAIFTPRAEE